MAAAHPWGQTPPLHGATDVVAAGHELLGDSGPRHSPAALPSSRAAAPPAVRVRAAPRRTHLMKKEAAADGPGVTSAAVRDPPLPHVFAAPSGLKVGEPSRTVSATATAATAASACGKGARVRNSQPLQGRSAHPGPHPGHPPAGTQGHHQRTHNKYLSAALIALRMITYDVPII